FDPGDEAVVLHDPGIPQRGDVRGSVTLNSVSPQELVLHTATTAPELVVVHDSFESGWTYSIDGSPSRHVLAADYFLQGLPVPAGRHTVVLRYTDPKIGQGLLASAIAWGGLLVGVVISAILGRRRSAQSPADL